MCSSDLGLGCVAVGEAEGEIALFFAFFLIFGDELGHEFDGFENLDTSVLDGVADGLCLERCRADDGDVASAGREDGQRRELDGVRGGHCSEYVEIEIGEPDVFFGVVEIGDIFFDLAHDADDVVTDLHFDARFQIGVVLGEGAVWGGELELVFDEMFDVSFDVEEIC